MRWCIFKQFYANFKIDREFVASVVNNIHVVFDARMLNKMFEMPNKGNDFCKSNTPSFITDYDNLKRSFFGIQGVTVYETLRSFSLP